MEYSLKQTDDNQEKLNELCSLTGDMLKNVKDFHRVSLTDNFNDIL